MTFTGYTAIGDAGNSPTNIGTNNYQWDDDLTLVRGKHSIDLGFDLIRLEYNMFQTGAEHGSEAFATRVHRAGLERSALRCPDERHLLLPL
jgi:hypothetical protein